MESIFASIIASFCLFICFLQGNFCDVCTPSTQQYKGPKLPKIPDHFSSDVIISLNGSNLLDQKVERIYVDAKRKLAAIVDGGSFEIGGKKSMFDHNRRQAVTITNNNCTVMDIADIPLSGLMPYGNNAFESGNDFFRFSEKYSPVYNGTMNVGPNMFDIWTVCLPALGKNNNFSILVTYLFTKGDAKSGPKLYGFATKAETAPRPLYATFVNMNARNPSSESLQVPKGVFCNMTQTKERVPKLPGEFEMNIEILMSRNKSGFNTRDYIDTNENYFRSDHHHKENGVFVPVHEIHDYNTGVSYMINAKTFSCKVEPLTNRSWDSVETDDHHHIRMRTATEFMGLDHPDYIYEGFTKVRGLPVDIFSRLRKSRRRPGETLVQKWYFSRPDWKIGGIEGPLNDTRVPVMLTFNWNGSESVMNFFNYDPVETTTHILWPLRSCYKNNRHYMYFRLAGAYDAYGIKNQRSVTNGIRNALAKVAKISKLRVSSVLIFKSGYGGVVAVRVYVLGVAPIKGTVLILHPKHEIPLKDAVNRIKTAITTGKLTVNFKTRDGGAEKYVSLNAQKKSYYDYFIDGPDPVPPTKRGAKGKAGMTSGAVAATSIALIVIVVLLTVIVVHFILKRRGVQLFNYSRHSDDATA